MELLLPHPPAIWSLPGKLYHGIVTGGGGFGVASGICKALSEYGARLIINEKDEEKTDSILIQCR